jgi:tetratricopeptide (TPR) repeat protein
MRADPASILGAVVMRIVERLNIAFPPKGVAVILAILACGVAQAHAQVVLSPEIDIQFSFGIPQDEYEKELEIAKQFFEKDGKCRGLLREQKWQDAELTCKAAVAIADQLPGHRALEKMGAYEAVGHAMLSLRRFQEALDYFSRAFTIGQTALSDTDPETGYSYRNLGVTNHMLGNLDKAREFYAKSERALQHAYDHIELEDARPGYLKTLKYVLQYHLLAAQESGAEKEAEEIKKRLAKLP